MILPSKQIALHKAGGYFYRVCWPSTTFNGATIPAYTEDFATRQQADRAAMRFASIGLLPESVDMLPARVLFPHLS